MLFKSNMQKLVKYITLTILIYFLFYQSTAVMANNDNHIIGGNRIGPVTLGQPLITYAGYLGKRNAVSFNFYDCPSRSMLIQVQDGIITGIMVYSSNYVTREGIKVGDSVSKMVSKYGGYLLTDSGALTYSELGLAFNVNNDKITRIMVIQASPDPLLGDKIVIPGSRAGNIKIGNNFSNVINTWGAPDSVENRGTDNEIKIVKYKRKAMNIIVVDEIIQGVIINSYKFRTTEGIGVDSTYQQVIKTYGSDFKRVKDSIMYESRGIGFYIHNNKVIEIIVVNRK
jgi:hypothetical protein